LLQRGVRRNALTSLPAENHACVVGVFILDELLAVWLNDYPTRGNYHLSLSGWERVLDASGFSVLASESLPSDGLVTSLILGESRRWS
jgi:hypothetical protein